MEISAEAINFLNKSLSFDKNDAQVYYNLAGAYIQNKEYEKALESIENCLRINPEFSKALALKEQLLQITSK